jgi:hypothetical protein
MFHKHEWEVLSETTSESKLEQAARLGASIKGHGSGLEKKYILILQCKKCGKLKRFVEEI